MNIKSLDYPENLLSLILDDVSETINEKQINGLNKALSMLTPREQKVVSLYFEEKRSYADCSKDLGVTRNRVYQIVHNIIRKLRNPIRKQYIIKGTEFEIGSIDISESLLQLELSNRLSNVLLRANCKTIADIIEAYKSGNIYRFRNLGAVGIDEIAKRITEYTDVKLKGE